MPEGDTDFSGRWRAIKQFVSKRMEAPLSARGEKLIWQRRFWEHVIPNDEDWRRHLDDIRYNPVRHGRVNAPEDWPYSSFPAAIAKGWYESGWGHAEPERLRGMRSVIHQTRPALRLRHGG
jgi:putative transposase